MTAVESTRSAGSLHPQPARPLRFAHDRASEPIPHCLEAERSVLGAMLFDARHLQTVTEIVGAPDFYLPRHALIFEAIVASWNQRHATTPIEVGQELLRFGRLNEVGHPLLLDLMEEGGLAGDVAGHARIVREKAEQRRVADVCLDAARTALAGEADAAEIRERVLENIGEARSGNAVTSAFAPLSIGTLSRTPAPRRWLLRHPTRAGVRVDDRHGDGLLPLGKAGLFVSAGGVGKTQALLQLAVSVITGRRWLDHFDVDRSVDGAVLVALAEETQDEVERRLFDIANALDLSIAERDEVERRLVVMPLAGIRCGVATRTSMGEVRPTRVIDDILRKLKGRTWSLIVFDPLSRWAGVPIDLDNTNATFVVTEFERVVAETGATVLVAHHTAKASRREGKAESRGASGLEDGVRWVASLIDTGDGVQFRQTKSNYSMPMAERDAVRLDRASGGVLRVAQAAPVPPPGFDDAADLVRLFEAVLKLNGTPTTRDTLAKVAGLRAADGRKLIDLQVAAGTITDTPAPGRRTVYGIGAVAPESVRHRFHTSRDGGTAEPSPAPTVRRSEGTAADGGTAGRRSEEGTR